MIKEYGRHKASIIWVLLFLFFLLVFSNIYSFFKKRFLLDGPNKYISTTDSLSVLTDFSRSPGLSTFFTRTARHLSRNDFWFWFHPFPKPYSFGVLNYMCYWKYPEKNRRTREYWIENDSIQFQNHFHTLVLTTHPTSTISN